MAFGPWDSGSYWLVRFLLLKGVAAVYLIAFLAAAFQFRALVGEDGLLPVRDYRERREFCDSPSLFYFFPSDRAAGAAAWAGVALSVLALAGAPSRLGVSPGLAIVAHVALWGAMWALYLSFVNAGQTFYGFGWESMLLETGFLATFLGPAVVAAPAVIVWLFRWVLFRDAFGSGLIKLRGDDCWRDLTCLDYHYETQPMPNPVSPYVHRAPEAFHRLGVAANHVAQLAVPFLFFAPQPLAAVAGAITVLFQGWLLLTGNFAWLNLLTIVLAFSTFSDPILAGALPAAAPTPTPAPLPLAFQVVIGGVALLVVGLSYYPARNMLSSGQVMNTAFDPLHLVNTYGAFGSITRERYELVVQGTDDAELSEDTEWKTYEFPGKPTDPERRPPQVAPYHHRLGWQLWFAAMSPSPRRHPWFVHLLAKLLAGDDETSSLLRSDPFPDDPPEHVRALRYRYRFTAREERRETGRWWDREFAGEYVEPVSLSDPRFRRMLSRFGWGETLADDSTPAETEATADD